MRDADRLTVSQQELEDEALGRETAEVTRLATPGRAAVNGRASGRLSERASGRAGGLVGERAGGKMAAGRRLGAERRARERVAVPRHEHLLARRAV